MKNPRPPWRTGARSSSFGLTLSPTEYRQERMKNLKSATELFQLFPRIVNTKNGVIVCLLLELIRLYKQKRLRKWRWRLKNEEWCVLIVLRQMIFSSPGNIWGPTEFATDSRDVYDSWVNNSSPFGRSRLAFLLTPIFYNRSYFLTLAYSFVSGPGKQNFTWTFLFHLVLFLHNPFFHGSTSLFFLISYIYNT